MRFPLRLNAEDQDVGRCAVIIFAEYRMRRGVKLNCDFCHPFGQPLAGANVKRHSCPAPVVHKKRNASVSVGLGVGIDARLLSKSRHIDTPDARRSILSRHCIVENLFGLHDVH